MGKRADWGGFGPNDMPAVYRPGASFVAMISAIVAYSSFMAGIGGLSGYEGDWTGPLVVGGRKLPELHFDEAWTYFVPVCVLVVISTVTMVGCLIALVRYPPPAGNKSRATTEPAEGD